ncbi:MAG: hypothetical protein GY726_01775 [Proteobacteria bacterium]|nr:hypothetical protein [Pseudomonadota bacterium]
MGHKVFIPVSDELVFDRPELISAPLRPYNEDLACYHWMDVRLNPDDNNKIAESFSRLRVRSSKEDSFPHTVAA